MSYTTVTYDALTYACRCAYPIDDVWDERAQRPIQKKKAFRIVRSGMTPIAILSVPMGDVRLKVADPRVGCLMYHVARNVCTEHPDYTAARVKRAVIDEVEACIRSVDADADTEQARLWRAFDFLSAECNRSSHGLATCIERLHASGA